ncbi:MAG TPA: histidine kinase [Flavipsychrobacter sp.]|nr:histidine kinase [Flavipsychrobacter sp.]
MKLSLSYFFSLLFIFIGFSAISRGQLINTFNYNIDNGLPSNYVYSVLTDHLGYLWIATEKGAVKYNGYEFKVFNQSDGVLNEDIWELCEDKQGRMWLSNISDEIGYVYNNKYYKAFAKRINHTVYPRDTRPIGNGVVFYTGGDSTLTIYLASNNTFIKYNLSKLFQNIFHKPVAVTAIIDENGHPVINCDNSFYKLSMQNAIPKIEFLCKPKDPFPQQMHNNSYCLVNNHLISYATAVKSNILFVINLNNGTIQRVSLENLSLHEDINYISFDIYGDRHLYFIADNNLFEYRCDDNGLKLVNTLKIKHIIGSQSAKVSSFHKDPFWNNCITTTTNGLWLRATDINHFKKNKNIDLEDYVCIGKLKDSLSFWWNSAKNIVIKVNGNGELQYYRNINLRNIFSIVPYSGDTFLVNDVFSYFLNSRTGKLVKENRKDIDVHLMIPDSLGSYYATTPAEFIKVNKNDDITMLDVDRYNDLIYDSLRQKCLAYNSDRVCIHTKNTNTIIQKEGLSNFGITQIEKIIVDNKYGNFFFKGGNIITIYDWEKNTYKELFKNFDLKESSLMIHNNILIVAGRMGVLFSKILGRDNISAPLFYPNLKNQNFNFVYDCIVLGKKLLLNTDNGTYTVNMPDDNEILNARTDSILYHYKFVITNKDTSYNFNSGDTVRIDQKDQRLLFDVINPYGNGRAKYIYKLSADTVWHDLNADELTLPFSLKPGKYHDLILKAYDNVWESNPTLLHIYIRPYWYQTVAGRRSIEIGTLLLIALLLLIAIIITRRSVFKTMQKRNQRMELELKSIYAQLNPHFVFNTLNSALNLISKEKLEDAQLYISKFAKLLRSYLNSSRNRFTTLSEELNNIRNYIDIQQTRFADLFTYEIIVSDNIPNPDKIVIPSLLLQPIVENAINHGLLPKETGGLLKIIVDAETSNEIICIIDDNGIGRKKSALNKGTGLNESHGTNLVSGLIDIINKYEKIKIEIRYFDKEEPLTGTIVQLKFKYRDYGKI